MLFTVLGPVGVRVVGRRISLARGRERTALAVLLAADGDVVSADRLIAALWGPTPPVSARKTLQSHMSRLRRNLRELSAGIADHLRSAPGGYYIDSDDGQIDARQFLELADRARNAEDPLESLSWLQAAEECWVGHAFGDLAEHPALSDAAQDLDRQRRAVAVDRAEALLALGRYDELTRILPGRLVEAPYDEHGHGQLMRALVATGRRAEALATFDQLRRRLQDELGVDPAPDLRGLHEEILQQDVMPAPPSHRRP